MVVEARPGTLRAGVADIRAGLVAWPIWWTLSLRSIRSQYRRTYLGPWWMTLQMVIFVLGLSFLFGVLQGQDLTTFIPYVTLGFVGFSWMTGMIQNGSTSLDANAAMIRTSPGPLSIYALRSVAGQTILFAHDAVVLILVLVVFQVHLSWSVLLLPVSLSLIVINGFAIGLWLGPLVARFRDVGQIVTSIVRVLFFFTPVFWVATSISKSKVIWLAGWNPLAYLLQLWRAPLLGQWPSSGIYIGCAAITLVNAGIGLAYFSRSRTRLAYWL